MTGRRVFMDHFRAKRADVLLGSLPAAFCVMQLMILGLRVQVRKFDESPIRLVRGTQTIGR